MEYVAKSTIINIIIAFAKQVLLVRFEVFTVMTMNNVIFWDMAPCRFCVNRRFGLSLQPPARAGSSLAVSSTLKMEAIRSFETWFHTRSTRCHIPEDGILQVLLI
jgi:hypothetical protein